MEANTENKTENKFLEQKRTSPEEEKLEKETPQTENKKGKKGKKPKKKIINFISSNTHKYEELNQIFQKELPDIEIKQIKIDLPELQGYPEEIVKEKLKYALNTKAKGNPILVEDTSLCFNSYGGLPGAYIKYFLNNIKPEGLYKMICAFDDHSAYAQSIFGLQKNKKGGPILFIGKTEGEIVEPRGSFDFGWDPCFLPKGFNKTYGEMSKDEKNEISHRGKSVNAMIKFFKENPDFF
jgi:inosine triphosphate pyrophosphatase